VTVLTLADTAHAADLAAYLRRLRRYEPGAAVRLRAAGGVLGVFGRPPFGVVTLRGAPLARPDDVDVTVAAPDLEASLTEGAGTGDLRVPSPLGPSAWPSPLPPTSGWDPAGTLAAGVVLAAVQEGVAEFRRHVDPVAAGPAARHGRGPGDDVAERVWSRPLPGPLDALPLRAAHAAQALGFLPGGDGAPPVAGHVHTAWTRLDAVHGSVLVRRTPSLPLQPVSGG
jgi:hypothetical protein